jgi:YVTN family beta-propeller protein
VRSRTRLTHTSILALAPLLLGASQLLAEPPAVRGPAGTPPGHGGVPPGHGGVVPGLGRPLEHGPFGLGRGNGQGGGARATLVGASQSSPIAVSPDDDFVWVVNPDNDSVTSFKVTKDGLDELEEIRVGNEPTNLAIRPDGRFVYVANTASGTVSVIQANPHHPRLVESIRVGTEPYGLAFTPNGTRLYVANARSNDISVIDPDRNDVVDTIDGVGLEPRGIAITNDGDRDDSDEKVYVTQFLGVDRPGVLIGADDYKEGHVTVISVADDDVLGEVVLNPMADTGFRSNGSALQHIPATNPPTFTVVTGAFPNMLNSIAIHGDHAYVPNTAASADGPVRFNVNVQAFLSVIDLRTDHEGTVGGVSQTINMNRGINFETAGPNKVFLPVPWHVTFAHDGDFGYAVSQSANVVVRVELDAEGTPTIHAPLAAGDPGAIVRIFVGQNPRGIAIDSGDERAYVANEVSRDVSVIDVATNTVIDTERSAQLPEPGTRAATLLIGKALFHTSTGVNLPELGPLGVTPLRMSSEGWSSCVACHPFGLTDGVVWIFGSGPRRTVPLNGSFNPHDPNDQKILNYSAIFDEIQDFEANIRGVSGGLGLITQADGVTPDPTLAAFNPANAGRSERLDALKEFVARGIRTPRSPVDADEVQQGRELFVAANCATCHGGGGWSSSRRDYTPPPGAAETITNGQLVRFLRQVGTFDPAAANEIRDNGTAPRGLDGFNPPSLLGVGSMTPVLHNGSAITILDVLANVTHRSAGTGGVDVLANASDRQKLAEFVASIDARTQPFGITSLLSEDAAKAALGAKDEVAAVRIEPLRNPARGGAVIAYALASRGPVELGVYDVRGKRVALLQAGVREAGRHETRWDGHDATGAAAASGIYFVRLSTDTATLTDKLVYVR